MNDQCADSAPRTERSVSGSLPSRAPADQGSGKGTREQGKDQGTNSSTARLADFQHARDEPGQPSALDDDHRWLVGYEHNRINGTVLLGGFNPALTETLRSKRWATLVRDRGWIIPARYLAFVERLLDGAGVDLFDIDGAPTPGQLERERRDDRTHTARVLGELHEARDEAAAHPRELRDARNECRRAYADAIAAKHTETEEPSDV